MSTSLNVASVFHLINSQLLHMTRATTHLVRTVDQNLASFRTLHALDLLAPNTQNSDVQEWLAFCKRVPLYLKTLYPGHHATAAGTLEINIALCSGRV